MRSFYLLQSNSPVMTCVPSPVSSTLCIPAEPHALSLSSLLIISTFYLLTVGSTHITDSFWIYKVITSTVAQQTVLAWFVAAAYNNAACYTMLRLHTGKKRRQMWTWRDTTKNLYQHPVDMTLISRLLTEVISAPRLFRDHQRPI